MITILFLPEVVNQFLELSVFYSIHKEDDKTIFLVRYLGNNHIIAHHLLDDGKL